MCLCLVKLLPSHDFGDQLGLYQVCYNLAELHLDSSSMQKTHLSPSELVRTNSNLTCWSPAETWIPVYHSPYQHDGSHGLIMAVQVLSASLNKCTWMSYLLGHKKCHFCEVCSLNSSKFYMLQKCTAFAIKWPEISSLYFFATSNHG